MLTVSDPDIAAAVREITDEEVEFYVEHGWVMLPGLITPELALEMRRVGEEFYARDAHLDRKEQRSASWLATKADAEPFPSFAFSEAMGRNAQRLVNRKRLNDDDIGVRYRWDAYVHRPPTTPEFMGRQGWHQDSSEHGSDRVGEMQWWIALDDITAELGPMRFIDKTHREGPLGSTFNEDGGGDLLALYPKLADRITPPMEYKLGDATVHHGYCAHGTLPNTTDRARLSFIISYTPADCRWWDGEVRNSGSERRTLGDELNPIIYPRT